MRGRHSNRPRKITYMVKKQVKDHIQSFPTMRSHYSRNKNKRRRYLSPLLSIAEMHRLYVKKYEGGGEKPLVKYHYYSKVFNEEFNFSFGYPKTDTCGTCEKFKIELSSLQDRLAEKQDAQQRHKEHLRSAEKFYADLRLDTEMAKRNSHVSTITFDFSRICHFLISLWVICFTCSSYGCTCLVFIAVVTTMLPCIVGPKRQRNEEVMKLYLAYTTSFPSFLHMSPLCDCTQMDAVGKIRMLL